MIGTRFLKAAGIALCASAVCLTSMGEEAPGQVKLGMYVGTGTFGEGVMGWARLLSNSPEVKLTLLDASDIRAGKHKDQDVLLMPGGNTGKQCKDLKPEGMTAIRDYVASGGKYIGTCAGCGLSMNIRIGTRILNCRNYKNTDRGHAVLPVDFSESGAKILGIKPGRWYVQYSSGPIPVLAPESPDWDGKASVCATYAGTLGGPRQRKMGDIYGHPAVVFATYGKGKLVSSGPHPEYYESTYPIALGFIYAVSGVKCTFAFPPRVHRPIRVAFHTRGLTGKPAFRAVIDLFKARELDVQPGRSFGTYGALDHVDVLVAPNLGFFGAGDREYVRKFMDRGGLVICFSGKPNKLEEHKNCRRVKSWQDVRPEIIKSFK